MKSTSYFALYASPITAIHVCTLFCLRAKRFTDFYQK